MEKLKIHESDIKLLCRFTVECQWSLTRPSVCNDDDDDNDDNYPVFYCLGSFQGFNNG